MQTEELKRAIVDLINLKTGLEESALDLLSRGEESVFKLRRWVEEGVQSDSPRYGCGLCGQPVVRSHRIPNGSHTFYFKHFYASGDCPVKTDSTYTK